MNAELEKAIEQHVRLTVLVATALSKKHGVAADDVLAVLHSRSWESLRRQKAAQLVANLRERPPPK